MPKNFTLALFFVIGLVLWLTGCQPLPGFNIFTGLETNQAAPQSKFVAPPQIVYVDVGRSRPIKIYSVSQADKFGNLEVKVNGNQIKFNRTSEGLVGKYPVSSTNFPPDQCEPNVTLALVKIKTLTDTIQVLPDQSVFELLTSKYPNSTWPVTLDWQSCILGTYNLSLETTDINERRSQPIVQNIEVRDSLK